MENYRGLTLALAAVGCQSLSDGLAVTPQRPTVSSDTSTTAVGSFELEAGGLVLEGGSAALPLSLKYGVAEGTEVSVNWAPYNLVDEVGPDTTGVGDVSVGMRHRLAEETERTPSLAIQPIVKLPTADEDRGLGTGEADLFLAGIATKGLADWTLTGFVQLEALGDAAGGARFGQTVAIAASRPLPGQLGFFSEVAGAFVPEVDAEQVFTTVGMTYNPFPSLVLDVGVIVGLNDEAPDYGVVFGFTHNLGPVRARRVSE